MRDQCAKRAAQAPGGRLQLAAASDMQRELERCLAWLEHAGLHALQAELRADPHARSYLLLPTGGAFESWLIRWPSGSAAPWHDHGPARGLVWLLDGELHEWRGSPDAIADGARCWPRARPIELPRGICHEVRNLAHGVAYSLHVYDPRLDHMTFYARGHGGVLSPLRKEVRSQW